MKNQNENLQSMGLGPWFQSRIDEQQIAAHSLARVVSVHKDSYIINNGVTDIFAELSGNLSYSSSSALDLPTSGDWVYADLYDDDTHAIIYSLMPRKTLIKRKTAGKMIDFQLIAANIDIAFIVQSADANFNLRRLERYLVMINESQITPVVLLSKSDLISQDRIDEISKQILDIAGNLTVLPFSNVTTLNIDKIKAMLLAGKTFCLLGSSGVGKTTLINTIQGNTRFKTQSVSKVGSKGRHTTTSRELIQLQSGAMVIDTPGMRELGNMSVNTGLSETFTNIVDLANNCKYGNCSHTGEKGCAILAAIDEGRLSHKQYKNYVKMKNESAFNEMSYSEKRRKDKDFGKLVKTAVSIKRNR